MWAFIPGAKERVVIRKELGLSNVFYMSNLFCNYTTHVKQFIRRSILCILGQSKDRMFTSLDCLG
jgi:hypothetical protein